MQKIAVVALACLNLASCPAFPQNTTTMVHRVYLRPDPSRSGDPVATLHNVQKVTLVDQERMDGFFHVKTIRGKEGWIGATYLTVGVPEPTSQFAAKFSSAAGCDTSLWNHVYHSTRLIARQKCIAVTGTIVDATVDQRVHRKVGVRKEPDGDTRGWMKLDPQFKNLLNTGNISDESRNGNLACEIVCMFKVSQANAKTACHASYHNAIVLPPVGTHVKIVGTYVQDTYHAKWMEIPPVCGIEVLQ